MSSAYHIQEYVEDVLPSAERSTRDAFGQALHKHILADAQKGDMPYPLYDTTLDATVLSELQNWAKKTQAKTPMLYVLGTGGSSLGGQALVSFMRAQANVQFIDNIDPHTLQSCEALAARDDIHWLIVSKSGGTLETVTQATVVLEALGAAKASECATVITGEAKSPLRDLAEHYGTAIHTHPSLGGRFSLFSAVGLIPAIWAGLDATQLLQGAKDTYSALFTEGANHLAARGASLQAAIMHHCPIHILMPYCDRLETLASWYKQLWAESLGKQGHGSTPVRALGTVDQHSQLQLYLEGPEDKFFSLICVDNAGQGPRMQPPLSGAPWDMLSGKTIGDVMQASQAGTVASLQHHRKPLRVIEISTLDAYSVGALAMHFMLETVLTASLLGINAYDQPAVEDGKQRTRDYLARPGKSEVA